MNKTVDYFFGDLSDVSSNQLRLAFQKLKISLKLNPKKNGKNEEAMLRIEGELLHRKEVKISGVQYWRSEFA